MKPAQRARIEKTPPELGLNAYRDIESYTKFTKAQASQAITALDEAKGTPNIRTQTGDSQQAVLIATAPQPVPKIDARTVTAKGDPGIKVAPAGEEVTRNYGRGKY